MYRSVVLRQRNLFSSVHPSLASQNQVEERVRAAARAMLMQVGFETIVVAERGFGRKPLLIRLARQEQDFVIRIDPDITVYRLSERHAEYHLPILVTFRQQALQCLQQWGMCGRRLSVGKLAEASAVDFRHHRRAWLTAWRL